MKTHLGTIGRNRTQQDATGRNKMLQDATRCYRTQLNKYSIYITYNLLVLLFFTFSFSSFNMPLSVLDCTINFCVNRIKLPISKDEMSSKNEQEHLQDYHKNDSNNNDA